MEALALGRTCVSSAFPGIASIIQDGEAGYVFKPGDPAALASVLAQVVSSARITPDRLSACMMERHDVGSCAPEMWRQIRDIAQAR
jgi:glycosyltransferase involved in cell wall biosynthesis